MSETPFHGGDRVFEVGYRAMPDRGKRQPPAVAIARTMLTLAWRQRATKIVLLVCLGVLAGHGVWLVGQLLFERFGSEVGAAGMPVGELVGSAREVLANFLRVQFFTTAIAVAVIAGGAIAEDRAAGAFDLYFARPLTRADYALGKLGGAGLVPFVTILLPVVLLWLTAIGIAPPALRSELWWLAVPALGGGILSVVVLATTIIGLSAVGQKARTVSIAYVAGLLVLSGIIEGLTNGGFALAGYFAPERSLHTVIDWLLAPEQSMLGGQISGRYRPINHSVFGSLVALLGWAGAGFGLFWWRLRSEVVG